MQCQLSVANFKFQGSSPLKCLTPVLLLLLVGTIILLAGCGGKRQNTPTSSHKIESPIILSQPAKKKTPAAKIPPTQKPYKIKGKTYYPLPSAVGFRQQGIASWYGNPFHGRKTSNGETYDMHEMTAAHKTLPMQTMVLVKNLDNNKESVVRINDRGPFVRGRIIDLSRSAAEKLNVIGPGTARVEVIALGETVTHHYKNKDYQEFLPAQDFEKGEFYIQVGAFTNPDNAGRLQKKLQKEGRNVVIQKYTRGDKTFHRVQVFAGTTLSGAARMETVLRQAGFPEAFAVAR